MSASRRTAIVTGGSSGIGAAICAALAAEGIRVFNADLAPPIDPDPAATFIACDICSDADVDALIASVAAQAGGIDILVNNAGGAGSPARIDALTSADWSASMALLLDAPRRMTTAVIPSMRARGGGAIVNIASICGVQPGWAGVAYGTAKAALIHLTKEAATQLAADAIRVNAVSPGIIPTTIFGRTRGYPQEQWSLLAEAIGAETVSAQPLRRSGSAQDIAAAVVFLAGESGRFVTGENLHVDGGLALAPAHVWDPQSESPVLRAIAAGERRMKDGRPA